MLLPQEWNERYSYFMLIFAMSQTIGKTLTTGFIEKIYLSGLMPYVSRQGKMHSDCDN
jgi:hypothetical protein